MFDSSSRFLIVDDSQSFREVVDAGLQELGAAKVEHAHDGKVAYKMIVEASESGQPYSMIFCDIHMPKVDGLKLLEMLRAEPKTKNTPVIMVTTESSKQAVVRAAMSGISGYIVKPFEVQDVKKKVREVYMQYLEKKV
jgi:two-component system, chemotaxis family, chemotaxis protein CheY